VRVSDDGRLTGCDEGTKSTTYPGSTEEIFVPLLEAGSGLTAGRDFRVGYSPERIDPSNRTFGFRNTPKLTSGVDHESAEAVAEFYGELVDDVVPVPGTREAELAKLLENTYRHVNIALVNELAIFCNELGIDVWSVLDAAATKPFGFMKFTPGPGVGGHCIPVDPYYLAWRAREFDFVDRFVELAGDINFAMPRHVVELVAEALNEHGRAIKDARVGIIGVAFKPNVRDARNSPAADVMAILAERGATVAYHDPHVPTFRDRDRVERSSVGLDELVDGADVVVVVTAHKAIDWDRVYASGSLIVDTVNSSAGRETRPRGERNPAPADPTALHDA